VPVAVTVATGLLTVFFSETRPADYEAAKACDLAAHAAFCRAMLERGIYLPPSQFEAWFPSLAHDEGHVERTLGAARPAFEAAASA
jgi:glutamate-1-semialdehyde 2,1-aminomutase